MVVEAQACFLELVNARPGDRAVTNRYPTPTRRPKGGDMTMSQAQVDV